MPFLTEYICVLWGFFPAVIWPKIFRDFPFLIRYLGDGPKLVRELFRVADEMSPTLVFIDEIDAVGSKRYDSNSGGTREIQRTMLELLNQLDGFDERGDVKVRFYNSGVAERRNVST